MRFNLDLSIKKKRKFYKKLDIIDMIFNIMDKDYKSIYSRDHEYRIRFNKRLYKFSSKADVKDFTVNINYEYTIMILELDDIYQNVFKFYRDHAHRFDLAEKNKVLQSISGIEYQFKYFSLNRYSANYTYYVTIQISKIINELKEILLLLAKTLDVTNDRVLFLLFWRLDNLEQKKG